MSATLWTAAIRCADAIWLSVASTVGAIPSRQSAFSKTTHVGPVHVSPGALRPMEPMRCCADAVGSRRSAYPDSTTTGPCWPVVVAPHQRAGSGLASFVRSWSTHQSGTVAVCRSPHTAVGMRSRTGVDQVESSTADLRQLKPELTSRQRG